MRSKLLRKNPAIALILLSTSVVTSVVGCSSKKESESSESSSSSTPARSQTTANNTTTTTTPTAPEPAVNPPNNGAPAVDTPFELASDHPPRSRFLAESIYQLTFSLNQRQLTTLIKFRDRIGENNTPVTIQVRGSGTVDANTTTYLPLTATGALATDRYRLKATCYATCTRLTMSLERIRDAHIDAQALIETETRLPNRVRHNCTAAHFRRLNRTPTAEKPINPSDILRALTAAIPVREVGAPTAYVMSVDVRDGRLRTINYVRLSADHSYVEAAANFGYSLSPLTNPEFVAPTQHVKPLVTLYRNPARGAPTQIEEYANLRGAFDLNGNTAVLTFSTMDRRGLSALDAALQSGNAARLARVPRPQSLCRITLD